MTPNKDVPGLIALPPRPYDSPALIDMLIALEVLERAVHEFTAGIERPVLTFVGDGHYFRFKHGNPLTIQVCKAARVVSGLHACLQLLRGGYLQEIAVVLRTVDDFLGEIAFLHDAHYGDGTADQQRFVDEFFADKPRSSSELLAGPAKMAWMPRKKKVQAAEGRVFKPTDPQSHSAMAAAIDEVFSGWVHGNYSYIMDMYGGDPPRFSVHGMPDHPGIIDYQDQVAVYVHRSLDYFAIMAAVMQMATLRGCLIDARRAFAESGAYARLTAEVGRP